MSLFFEVGGGLKRGQFQDNQDSPTYESNSDDSRGVVASSVVRKMIKPCTPKKKTDPNLVLLIY